MSQTATGYDLAKIGSAPCQHSEECRVFRPDIPPVATTVVSSAPVSNGRAQALLGDSGVLSVIRIFVDGGSSPSDQLPLCRARVHRGRCHCASRRCRSPIYQTDGSQDTASSQAPCISNMSQTDLGSNKITMLNNYVQRLGSGYTFGDVTWQDRRSSGPGTNMWTSTCYVKGVARGTGTDPKKQAARAAAAALGFCV